MLHQKIANTYNINITITIGGIILYYIEIPMTPQANLAPALPVFNDS